jgi:hypothetical protein
MDIPHTNDTKKTSCLRTEEKTGLRMEEGWVRGTWLRQTHDNRLLHFSHRVN